MKIRAMILVALTGVVLLPEVAQSQVFETVIATRQGRGMLGILTEAVRGGTEPSRQRVVVDVVAGSAAERAGLQRGDTILRVNALAATEQVMSSPFEPGDTVVLRVRRNNVEREVTVVAGLRPAQPLPMPAQFSYTLPDSVQHQMNVIIRSVRDQLDTMTVHGKLPFFGDTVFTFGRGDTVRVFRYGPDDGISMNVDSLLNRFMNVPADMARIFGDTTGIRIYTRADGNPATVRMDTVHFLRPAEALSSGMVVGMRSVAGAELAELNPGLAEYFGAMSGVLVIDARDGTPAARAGIRAGDIITRVGDTNVSSIAELRRAMAGGPPRQQIRLRVLRHGQPVDVTLGG